MKRSKLSFLMIASLIFFLTTAFYPAYAFGSNKPKGQVIPEVDGIYDVQSHPGLKVRVFVHKARPNKPGTPGGSSTLQCTLVDPAGEATVNGAGWIIPSGTWKYRVNQNVPSTISSSINEVVNMAFTAWKNILPTRSGVSLAFDGSTSVNRAVRDGQNIIAWGRTSGSALGVTYVWYQNGVALELDTIMNQKFSWNWGGGSTQCAYTNVYDAQNILTHELGHWFGLDDEYDQNLYQNHTMYGYGAKMEVKKDTLTAGDIAGINNIY